MYHGLGQTNHKFYPVSQSTQKAHAYELLDWIRLSGVKMTPKQASRVMDLIEVFDKSALQGYSYFLHPEDDLLWPTLIMRGPGTYLVFGYSNY